MRAPTIPIPGASPSPAPNSGPAQPPHPIAVGDIVPSIRLPIRGDGAFAIEADDTAGRYLVFVLCPDASSKATQATLSRFAESQATLKTARVRLFAICGLGPDDNRNPLDTLALPFPVLCDPSKRAFALFAPKGGLTTAVVRPNRHLMALFGSTTKDHGAAVAALIDSDATNRQAQQTDCHPPVLMVPDVLSREDCNRLITIYNLQGNVFVDPGHGSKNMQGDYKMRIPEYGRKDRIDHWVINEETTAFIVERLRARLFPEIEKAFQYRITRFERFRIGSYEGERGGEAHGHRDNSEALVAHRRFAASINLNSEQFEGGELRFPEYGGHLYRPETGAAIAFSSSILHEPLHVTSGRRFVLLAFLFGDR